MELTGAANGTVQGNLYELDYQQHFQHIRDAALPVGANRLIYESGMREIGPKEHFDSHPDKYFGEFVRYEMQPRDPELLQTAIRQEQRSREPARPGDFKEHLAALHTGLIEAEAQRKLVKTQTEIELDKAYVLCAVSSGASRSRVLFVHILPNIIRPLVHFLCLSCAEMIMNISAFSFIGLTLGDDVIDWGSMLSAGRSMLMTHPSLLFLPILFIFLCTLAFNLLAKQLEGGDAA